MLFLNSRTSEVIELVGFSNWDIKDSHCLRYYSDSNALDSSLAKIEIVLDSVLGNLIYLFSSSNYSKQDIGSLIQIADNDFKLKDADPRNWKAIGEKGKRYAFVHQPSKI